MYFFKFQLKDASKLLKRDASHHRMYKLNRLDFSSNYDDKQLTHPTHHINKEEERRVCSDDKLFQGTNEGNIFFNVFDIGKRFCYLPIYYLLPFLLMVDNNSKNYKVNSWDTKPEVNLFPHSFTYAKIAPIHIKSSFLKTQGSFHLSPILWEILLLHYFSGINKKFFTSPVKVQKKKTK